MKLIDLLVQELPKRGGWTVGGFATQDGVLSADGCCVSFWDEAPESYGDGEKSFWADSGATRANKGYGVRILGGFEVAEDFISSVISREQYEAALAASKQPEHNVEPWIEWNGGRCPVEQATLVDVQYRDGEILCRIPANKPYPGMRDAQASFWRNEARENDIVAYRLSESEKWNGEGLPPVGELIEVNSPHKGWISANVVAVTDTWLIARYDDGVEFAGCHRSIDERGVWVDSYTLFRPIRTEAERKREQVGLALYHAINWNAEGEIVGPSRMEDYRKAYDAIAAGKIPGIKLDN